MRQDDVATLAPASRDTATAVAALLDRELGSGLYRPEWLLEDAANPAAGVWLVRPPDPIAAAVARLLGPGDGEYYRGFGPAAMDLFPGTVGSFEALAVHPEHRRSGLGTLLTATSLDWMRAQGCTAAVTLSWRGRATPSSAGLFRRLGMREGPTLDRFYLAESVRDGWICPVCQGPCTCPATLFTLPLT
jgi:ribosomal protein S18 acetylase RimI-like enzyme